MSLEELMAVIKEAKTRFEIEGATYSGGEPTCQQNLSLLTKEIKLLGLGVISFTLNTDEEYSSARLNEIMSENPFIKSIERCDEA